MFKLQDRFYCQDKLNNNDNDGSKKWKSAPNKRPSHTTRNYSLTKKIFTTLLVITRVTSNFSLPYPTLLGFEKALLVIAWSAGHILAPARQAQVYRNISAGLQHFIAMHCWMIFNEYHTADKATIYKCTNFQHYLSLLLSAASTHTIKQYPATNPQPTSTLTTRLRKAFRSRRLFRTVSKDNI